MKVVVRLIAGVIAGAIGAYAGLFALFSATGLDHPSWAPVAMLTGAALLGSATVVLLARLSLSLAAAITAAATATGAVAGFIVGTLRDNYEWTFVAGAAIVGAVVVASRRLGEPQTAD